MKKTPFIIERVFDAPIQDVWRAITEKELMKQWYFDLPDFNLKWGLNGKFGVDQAPKNNTYTFLKY